MMTTIKRSELNKLVQAKSPWVPKRIRAAENLALAWTGTAWNREPISPEDVIVIEA